MQRDPNPRKAMCGQRFHVLYRRLGEALEGRQRKQGRGGRGGGEGRGGAEGMREIGRVNTNVACF